MFHGEQSLMGIRQASSRIAPGTVFVASNSKPSTVALEHLANHAIAMYRGGECFFSALDSAVRCRRFIDLLIGSSGERPRHVVVSGRFGWAFWRYSGRRIENLIVVVGGLRTAERLCPLDGFEDRIRGRGFVFFDDSYYSGQTRLAVKGEIERLGGWLENTYVLYDGSRQRDPSVFGILRYHAD